VSSIPLTRLLVLATCAWGPLLACAHAPPGDAAFPNGTPPSSEAVPPAEPAPPPLAPLTADEQALRTELEKQVKDLADLGPRSLAHTWNLYSATDDLARRLEILGHQVGRQGFSVGDEVLQNLEVVLPGKISETLVVAAHYDTSAESPGADASATGAAVLIALAKGLVGRHLDRSLRLVWLCNETATGAAAGAAPSGTASPGAAPSGPTGSDVYARHLQQLNVPVVATLTLGGLGLYALGAGTQRYPEELLYGAEKRTHIGNFIGLLSNASSNALLERVRPALASASLPVEELILPDTAPLAAEGAQAHFWSAGLSGLLLTDTAGFRSAHYDDPLDTLDKIDFDRLARVAKLLESLVFALAGPPEAVPSAG
jgi:hypothetical protein